MKLASCSRADTAVFDEVCVFEFCVEPGGGEMRENKDEPVSLEKRRDRLELALLKTCGGCRTKAAKAGMQAQMTPTHISVRLQAKRLAR